MKIHYRHIVECLLIIAIISGLFYLGMFIDAKNYGLQPGNLQSPLSLFAFVIIHSSTAHLVGNLYVFIPISFILFYFYNKASLKVIFWIVLVNGVLLYFLGRKENVHIGSSGLIYGICSFLLIASILKANKQSFVILTLTLFISHRMLAEVIPLDVTDITISYSWESHFFGFVTGVALGFIYGWDKLSSYYTKL